MNIAVAIAAALAGSVLVAFAFRAVFQSLRPEQIQDYRPCKGGWWEAALRNCSQWLLSLPQQPVNTYSNLAYLAAGLFISFYLVTITSYVLALTLLYLCVGSALYHAFSTRWAGSLDVSGIYAVFSALMVHSLNTWLHLSEPALGLSMFVVAMVLGYLLRYQFRGVMELKIGLCIILIYVPAIYTLLNSADRSGQTFLIISFVAFLLGFLSWIADKHRFFPMKRWGHGCWHLFTAAGIVLVYYANCLIQA